MPLAIRLSGALDQDALWQALDDVIGRHESLRTVFAEVDGVPVQQVRCMPGAGIEAKVSQVTEDDLADAVKEAAREGFDLASAEPLVRARLFQVAACAPTPDGPAAGEWVLVLVMHHAVTDGWSMAPLARDLSAAYAARCEGRAPGWAPLPVQYADYAIWQRDLLGSPDDPASLAGLQVAYWKEALRGVPEELSLPAGPGPAAGGVAPRRSGGRGRERGGAPAAGGAGPGEPRERLHGAAGRVRCPAVAAGGRD